MSQHFRVGPPEASALVVGSARRAVLRLWRVAFLAGLFASGCAAIRSSEDVVGIRKDPALHAAQIEARAFDRPPGGVAAPQGLIATEYLQGGASWRGVLHMLDGSPASSPAAIEPGEHRLTVGFEWLQPPDADPGHAKIGECALDFAALPGETYRLRTSHGRDAFIGGDRLDPREWAAWIIEDGTWVVVSNGSCQPTVD